MLRAFLSVIVLYVSIPAYASEIAGKFVDTEDSTKDVMKSCSEELSDRLITITKSSIQFLYDVCKVVKVEQWPSGQNVWDYRISCPGKRLQNLILSNEGAEIRVQHREGPLSRTAGVVYRRCPSSNAKNQNEGSALNTNPPRGFPRGRYYFKVKASSLSPEELCSRNVNETEGRIDFGRRQIDFLGGSCRTEEISPTQKSQSGFTFNAHCTSTKNNDVTPRRFQLEVNGGHVVSTDITDLNRPLIANYLKCPR